MNIFLLCMISCTIVMFPYIANFVFRYRVLSFFLSFSTLYSYILPLLYDSLRGEATCNAVLILGCGGRFSS